MRGPVLVRDVARGTGDSFYPPVCVQHRNENVLVVAALAGGAGEGCGVPDGLPGIDDLLNLELQLRGQIRRISELEEILPVSLFERFLPKREQRLIHISEAAVQIEDVDKVGYVRKSGIEGVPLLMQVCVRLLLVFNIGAGSEPLRDISVVAQQGNRAHQMPAPSVVASTYQSKRGFVRLSRFERSLPALSAALAFVRMDLFQPPSSEQSCFRHPEIGGSLPVHIIQHSVRLRGPHHLRNALGEKAITDFGALALRDVFYDGDHFDRSSLIVAPHGGRGAAPEQFAVPADVALFDTAGVVRPLL